jgi:hypothetical protein
VVKYLESFYVNVADVLSHVELKESSLNWEEYYKNMKWGLKNNIKNIKWIIE